MMIVGLGNPGLEYTTTRHNVGFLALDALAQKLDVTWEQDRSVTWAKYNSHWLLKPQTYMNRSGSALHEFFKWHNLPTDSGALHQQLLVIHDDLDFPVGTTREQRDRSSAGHNGVQSIIDAFSTKDFTRIRVGIATPALEAIPTEEFVLQTFAGNERPLIEEQIQDIIRRLEERL